MGWLSRSTVILGVASSLAILATGCVETAAVGPVKGITVSVIAAGVDEPSAGGGALGPVEIDGLRLVLGGIKLETASRDGTVDWVLAESRVVEVDVSGDRVTAHTVLDVPAGMYKEVEISIDKLEPGNAAEEPLIAQHPDVAEASIAVTGRVVQNGSGEPFIFTAALDRDMEILLEPFLVITGDDRATGVQVTLLLRTARWFLDAAGARLDPRDPANRSAIEANIQASFEAFEDADKDGRPGPIER